MTSRVLLVLHQPSGVPIDLALGALPLKSEIVRRSIIVPGPEHEDLEEVLLNHRQLNTENSIEVVEHVFVHPGIGQGVEGRGRQVPRRGHQVYTRADGHSRLPKGALA